MILAQYTIRSKQEYIFRSNRLLDIVGGTEMIRDAFDWVFAAAEQEGVTCQPADVPFKLQAVQDAFAAGTLGMAELFRGGGNLTVLYRDRDTYLRVNRRFSRLVLENAPGMVPMAACCEANGQNYSADYSALMAAVDAEKNRMLPGRADYAAPFALRDRTTNQPIVCRVPFAGGQRELTAESRKKWEKGQRSDKRNDGNRLLDEMTTEWQEESLLAVIHADGNNMGVKIQQKLNGSIDYDFCVSTMRAFTAEIADAFTRTGETSLRDTMAYLQKEGYPGLKAFADGVDIGDDTLAKSADLRILKSGKESEIELTITEGRFHQVKRMFHAVGKEVIYLKRLSMGSLALDKTLTKGEYRSLTEEEIKKLC